MSKFKESLIKQMLAFLLVAFLFIPLMQSYIFAAVPAPDWNDTTKNEKYDKIKEDYKWPLDSYRRIVKIGAGSWRSHRLPGLSYIGKYYDANGRVNLKFRYAAYYSSSIITPNTLQFYVDPALRNHVDWNSSYAKGISLPNQELVRFSNYDSTGTAKELDYGKLIPTGTAKNRFAEIVLVLNDGFTMDQLEQQDYLIQARILDEYNRYLSQNMPLDTNENDEETQYRNITLSTIVDANQNSKINRYSTATSMQTTGEEPFGIARGIANYSPEEGLFRATYVYTKYSWPNINSGIMALKDGNEIRNVAYSMTFDKSIIDILEEDENGFVGSFYILNAAGNPYITNKDARTKFKKSDINIIEKNGKQYAALIFGTNNFKYYQHNNDESSKLKTTIVQTPYDKNIAPSGNIVDGFYNVVDFKVDKKNINDVLNASSNLSSINFTSAFLLDNQNGFNEFKTSQTGNVIVEAGKYLTMTFDNDIPDDSEYNFYYGGLNGDRISTKRLQHINQQGLPKHFDLKSQLQSKKAQAHFQGKNIYAIPMINGATINLSDTKITSHADINSKVTVSSLDIIKFEKTLPVRVTSIVDDNGGKKIKYIGGEITIPAGYTVIVENNDNITKGDEIAYKLSNPAVYNKVNAKNYTPEIMANSDLSFGMIMLRDYRAPRVTEIFINSNTILGYTVLPNMYVTADIRKLNEQTGKIEKYSYNVKSDSEANRVTSLDGKTWRTAEFKIDNRDADAAGIFSSLSKDLPVSFLTAQSGNFDSQVVVEQVQATVYFVTDSANNIRIEKVAPLNKNYSHYPASNIQEGIKAGEKNPDYIPNGFEHDPSSPTPDQRKLVNGFLPNHEGNKMVGSVLELRKFPVNITNQENTKKAIGWTTTELKDDATGTALKKYNDLLKAGKIIRNASDWNNVKNGENYIFDKYSPVIGETRVYAVWTNGFSINLHANRFATDTLVVQIHVTESDFKNGTAKISLPQAFYDRTQQGDERLSEFKKSKHTFVGWTATKDNENLYSVGHIPSIYWDGNSTEQASGAVPYSELKAQNIENPEAITTGTDAGLKKLARVPNGYKLVLDGSYEEWMQKGELDLYAAYKPYFEIKLTRQFKEAVFNSAGKISSYKNYLPNFGHFPGLRLGLIYRTHVTDYTNPTLARAANYYTIDPNAMEPGFEIFKVHTTQTPSVTWEVPGYDKYGVRLSYASVIVEQEDRYYNFKQNWANLGITIFSRFPQADGSVVSDRNAWVDPVDTSRKVYKIQARATHGLSSDLHSMASATSRKTVKATTSNNIKGYDIIMTDIVLKAPIPVVEDVYHLDGSIYIRHENPMVNKIIIKRFGEHQSAMLKNYAINAGIDINTGYYPESKQVTNYGIKRSTLEITIDVPIGNSTPTIQSVVVYDEAGKNPFSSQDGPPKRVPNGIESYQVEKVNIDGVEYIKLTVQAEKKSQFYKQVKDKRGFPSPLANVLAPGPFFFTPNSMGYFSKGLFKFAKYTIANKIEYNQIYDAQSEDKEFFVLPKPTAFPIKIMRQEGDHIVATIPGEVTNAPKVGTKFYLVNDAGQQLSEYYELKPGDLPGKEIILNLGSSELMEAKTKGSYDVKVKTVMSYGNPKFGGVRVENATTDNIFTMDFTPPEISTAKLKDDRFRYYIDIAAEIEEIPDGQKITIKIKDTNGSEEVIENLEKSVAIETIGEIQKAIFNDRTKYKYGDDLPEISIIASDRFGNKNTKKLEYDQSYVLMISAEDPLIGDDFVIVYGEEDSEIEVEIKKYVNGENVLVAKGKGTIQPNGEVEISLYDINNSANPYVLVKGDRVYFKGSKLKKVDGVNKLHTTNPFALDAR